MTWVGYGVSFQTPPGATIFPDTSRFAGLPGARVEAFVGGGDVPDFVVNIAARPSRDVEALSTWLDSLRAARNQRLDGKLAQLAPPKTRPVGTFEGRELLPFCGDCAAHEVYVQTDSYRVAFEYSLESGSLLSRLQQDSLYERMLQSVQSSATRLSNKRLKLSGAHK